MVDLSVASERSSPSSRPTLSLARVGGEEQDYLRSQKTTSLSCPGPLRFSCGTAGEGMTKIPLAVGAAPHLGSPEA